jgi:hypothetical protein
MTGARFPDLSHPYLDAVGKIEDVVIRYPKMVAFGTAPLLPLSTSKYGYPVKKTPKQTICRKRPPSSKHRNRRFAGKDLTVGDRIVEAGEVIYLKTSWPLALFGFRDVRVTSCMPAAQIYRIAALKNRGGFDRVRV